MSSVDPEQPLSMTLAGPSSEKKLPGGLRVVLALILVGPYALLLWLSLGTGWTFPRLAPDRFDFRPWANALTDQQGLAGAIVTSLVMSIIVGTVSTSVGLVAGRFLRKTRQPLWRFAAYLPYVMSPVIAGVGLYDLLVRIQLAGTVVGVIFVQSMYATAFASVFFSELWSSKTERLERLVSNLGGGIWQVWRHAILPRTKGLIAVCFLQSALYSWMDYALVSFIGGGQVETATLRVFAYLREANVNQAAAAALILVIPAFAACIVCRAASWVRFDKWERSR